MTRHEGPVLDDERLSVTVDDSGDETDTDDLGVYDPHVGMPANLSLAEYTQALNDKLLSDDMWGKTDPEKTQRSITRLKIQEAPWKVLYWAQRNREDILVKKHVNHLTSDVKTGVMMTSEWNYVWTGVGQWMRKKYRKEMEQRQEYETAHQHPRVVGMWTRMNSVHARRYLVGKGLRGDVIDRPLRWRIKAWGWEGKQILI